MDRIERYNSDIMQQWNEFKQKMAHTLREDALTGDEIFSDTEAKNYIVNYMEKSILTEKSENERLIMNINIRLAHMTIETATGPKVYPIILEYKGHHLMKVSFIKKNLNYFQKSKFYVRKQYHPT